MRPMKKGHETNSNNFHTDNPFDHHIHAKFSMDLKLYNNFKMNKFCKKKTLIYFPVKIHFFNFKSGFFFVDNFMYKI